MTILDVSTFISLGQSCFIHKGQKKSKKEDIMSKKYHIKGTTTALKREVGSNLN